MAEIIKEYSNDEITIVWKPSLCIHSTRCWKGNSGLRSVFNPSEKPWIKPTGAPTADIIERVNNCPSGALSFFYKNGNATGIEIKENNKVEVVPNGPLLVYGNIQVKLRNGEQSSKHNITAFCRCGASSNKPYCDGTHVGIRFNDEPL